MSILKRIRPLLPVLGFIAAGLILYLPMRGGVGWYWDWSIPLTAQDFGGMLSHQLTAWIDRGVGGPQGYASDLWVRAVFSLFQLTSWDGPTITWLMYGLLGGLQGYFVFSILRRSTGLWVGVLLAALAICNPGILYKLIAGHSYYTIALTMWLATAWFLLTRYRGSVRDHLVVGALLSFSGVQVQYFILTGLLVAALLVVRWRTITHKTSLPLIIAVPILLNAYWLVTFFGGQATERSLGSLATVMPLASSAAAGLDRVAHAIFAEYVQLGWFTPDRLQWLWGIWTIGLVFIWSWVRQQKVVRTSPTILGVATVWTICMLMATGLMVRVGIPVISPLFREVGHIAPLLMVSSVLLVGLLWPALHRVVRTGIVVLALVLVTYGVRQQNRSMPRSPLRSIVADTNEFRSWCPQTNEGYRIAAYPFFGQFRYLPGATRFVVEDYPLMNSGSDSFSRFACPTFFDSNVQSYAGLYNPKLLKELPHYAFSQGDVGALADEGVRYVFDYSGFMRSQVGRYLSVDEFTGDKSALPGDPEFLENLAAANPEKIEQVAPNVFRLIDEKPIFAVSEGSIRRITPTHYELRVPSITNKVEVVLRMTAHKGWKVYGAEPGGPAVTWEWPWRVAQTMKGGGISASSVTDFSMTWQLEPGQMTEGYQEVTSGDRIFHLVYTPELSHAWGLVISVASGIVLLFALIFLKNRHA